MKNESIQKKYLRRAKIASLILQLVPFIRMVGLNGSVARGEANDKSDIDFIIITKRGRIWTCRAATLFLMIIIGLKRYSKKIAGRVCLNLYQSEDKFELTTKTKILAKNHSFTKLMWQERDQFEEFMRANKWIQSYGYDFKENKLDFSNSEKIWSFLFLVFRKVGEFLFDLFFYADGEKFLSQIQSDRILRDPRTKKSHNGEIFISDKELRFHPFKD